MGYDIVVKNGLLVDPSQGLEEYMDLALSRGVVADVKNEISAYNCKEVIDASGMIVTPGLIDLHAHVYKEVIDSGVDADLFCLGRGVTTVVDGGSSGSSNFMGFRRFIIEKSHTRILCFLNISGVGLSLSGGIGELEDLRNVDFNRTVMVARENKDVVVGIKVRVSEDAVGRFGPQSLRLAKEAARTVNLPLMVHIFGPGPLPKNLSLAEVLKVLEKGDIVTHIYHPPFPPFLDRSQIFGDDEELIREVIEASERGVLFDVGHGRHQFSWDTAEKAIRQEFKPSTISTDLVTHSVTQVVFDLPTVVSKFLYLGLSLSEVIEKCTVIPASILGLEDRIGTLKPGAEGDVSIFNFEEGRFPFWDNIKSIREKREIKKLLKPIKVIKGGKLIDSFTQIR